MKKVETLQCSHHLAKDIVFALRQYAEENSMTQRMVIESALKQYIPEAYFEMHSKYIK